MYRDHVIPVKLRWLLVGFITVSAVLFLTGIVIEKSGHSGAAAATTQQQGTPSATRSGDPDGGNEGASTRPAPSAEPAAPSETILGVDIEAPWFIAAYLLCWLVLGVAVFRFGRPALLALLLVAIATVMLDGAEVIHQINEANTTIIIFAGVVAATHLVLAALAGLALTRTKRQSAAAV